MASRVRRFAWLSALSIMAVPAAFAETGPAGKVGSPPDVAASEVNYGAWNLRCETRRDVTPVIKICGLISTVTLQNETGQSAIAMKIILRTMPSSGNLQLSVDLPISVWLPDGVSLVASGTEIFRLPFLACQATSCEAGMVLTKDQVAKLPTMGEQATAVYKLQTRKTVKLAFSLKGFSAGLEALQRS